MATLNVSLTNEMRDHVREQVKSGRYANASDYIRDLIRRSQTETDAIRLALIEGEQSGRSKLKVRDILKAKRPRKRG